MLGINNGASRHLSLYLHQQFSESAAPFSTIQLRVPSAAIIGAARCTRGSSH